MTDISSNGPLTPNEDTLRALRELANSPRVLKAANTSTFVHLRPAEPSSNNFTSTTIVDVRELAENVMFDATRLVATLDQIEIPTSASPSEASFESDMVAVSAVLKGGAVVTLAFAAICLVGTEISGTVLVHPLLCWLLILSSIGFYAMGKARP